MEVQALRNILRTFADRPEDVEISHNGEGLVQVQGEAIYFSLRNEYGHSMLIEAGHTCPVERWIAERLANLPLLADRILSYTDENENFIVPSGMRCAQLNPIDANVAPNDQAVDDVVAETVSLLTQNNTRCSTYTLYLTSDAGEGKTTIITQIARNQASAYKCKNTDWLLLPIPLGGRPFSRLDDLVVGAIVNNYRFRHLYYDGFIELVKLGFLVPAFDGFEEMFVLSNSGEAVSSLGHLIDSLDSSGRLLVAARKAYFEIRSFGTQARLFDALPGKDAMFDRIKINRWTRNEFLMYWNSRKLPDGEGVYRKLLSRINDPQHPMLTRAVLVERLAEMAKHQSLDDFLGQLDCTASTYFSQIVDSFIQREIKLKWVDIVTNQPDQLLGIEQHHELLATIAIEMASDASSNISGDNLRLIAQLYCQEKKVPAHLERQIVERIYDYPLLNKIHPSRDYFAFDHDEFKDFFIGEGMARQLVNKSRPDVKRIIRRSILSDASLLACISFLGRYNRTVLRDIISLVQDILRSEQETSYARENCGKLLVRLWERFPGTTSLLVSGAVFSNDIFCSFSLNNIRFSKCVFRLADFSDCGLSGCVFENCEFESVILGTGARIENVSIVESKIYSISHSDDTETYDPKLICDYMRKGGFEVIDTLSASSGNDRVTVEQSNDFDLALVIKMLRIFQRSTGVNDGVISLKLGHDAGYFFDTILPKLLQRDILLEAKYTGSGKGKRFRLAVPMSAIDEALRQSMGNFESFCSFFAR